MHDTAVWSKPGVSNSPAVTQRRPGSEATDRAGDDDLLAHVLIASWTLAGPLPAGGAPQSLTEDELISFWADDQMAAVSNSHRPLARPLRAALGMRRESPVRQAASASG